MPSANTDRQRRAYQVGSRLAQARLEQEAPDAARALREVEASDVVVVDGCYDHVERVLGALDLPFTSLTEQSLQRATLRPEQLLVVNCPGNVGEQAIPVIRDFVASGGSLFTTDWALQNVIEPAFPGFVEFNQRPTRDDVVGIEVCSATNPFLDGVLDGQDDPQWWLEGSSYPIRILDPARVEVLLRSRALEKKYGEAPVAVLFHYGKGEVFHMISHYYLQRTELRDARHKSAGASYFAEKGVPMSPETTAMVQDLSLGEVQAAATSTRFLANLVASKKQRGARQRSARS
jgi:hypothetical protein